MRDPEYTLNTVVTERSNMRNEGARDKLRKRANSLTEEHVKAMLVWVRSRHGGRVRRRQTPLQEFEANLVSMTNADVEQMLAGTQQKRPRYLASLIRLPGSAIRAVAKMVGLQPAGRGSS